MEKVEKIRTKVKQVWRQRLEIQKKSILSFSHRGKLTTKRWVHTCHLLDRKGTTATTDDLSKSKATFRVSHHRQKNPKQEIHSCRCIRGKATIAQLGNQNKEVIVQSVQEEKTHQEEAARREG